MLRYIPTYGGGEGGKIKPSADELIEGWGG